MRLKCQIFCACELFCEYLDLVAYLLIGLQLVNLYPKYIIKIKVDILGGGNLNICTLTLKP